MSESVSVFGKSRSLVGILTDPPGETRGDDLPAIVLLNAGIIHRVGPNRLYVKMARILAASGFVAFRFDLSGIGDSPVRGDNLPFEESAVRETQEAMEHLSISRGSKRFILLGISSGAVTSYKTACRDTRVAGAILINPNAYGQELWSYAKARRYWKTALSDPRRWARVLTGRVNYRMIGPRLTSVLSGRRKARSVANHVASDFHSLIERGVDLRLLYTRGDLGIDCLDVILGGELRELSSRGRLTIDMIDDADHTCTSLKSQRALLELVQKSALAVART